MSEKEVMDCERIAKLPLGDATAEVDGKTEQARLFELLHQRKYNEAIAGFKQRLEAKRGDSRDYYGLAVAHEQLKAYKQAVLNANKAHL
jgi:tetratricopeptide (TPR) repeat protein